MKTEHSKYQQSGFFCTACANHVKTYNGLFPSECPHCLGLQTLRMEWNQEIEIMAKVNSLPLVQVT